MRAIGDGTSIQVIEKSKSHRVKSIRAKHRGPSCIKLLLSARRTGRESEKYNRGQFHIAKYKVGCRGVVELWGP